MGAIADDFAGVSLGKRVVCRYRLMLVAARAKSRQCLVDVFPIDEVVCGDLRVDDVKLRELRAGGGGLCGCGRIDSVKWRWCEGGRRGEKSRETAGGKRGFVLEPPPVELSGASST